MLPANLDDVLATDDLVRRASRLPDHAGESEALRELMDVFARTPRRALQRLAEIAMARCDAQSAGLSVEEDGPDGGRVFRWVATAGVAEPLLDSTLPCDASPCGLVVGSAKPQLLQDPARAYPAVAAIEPPVSSTLIVPFLDEGTPIGTLWVIDHGAGKRPFDAEDARLLESLASFATIAWRSQTERQAVREGEAFLRLVTDRLPVRVAYIDREFRFRFMNDAYEREVGLAPASTLGRTIAEAAGPAVFEAVRANLERALGGESHSAELVAPYASGAHRIQVSYVPDCDAAGEVRGVVVQALDVTELRRSELAVREREADLRAILDASAGGFYGVDAEGRTTTGNAAFLSMLGIARMEDVVGEKLHGAIHHSHPDGSPYPVEDCPIYRAASSGKPAHVVDELFFRVDDGTPFPVEYWTQPILVDGENRGAVTTFLDITERKAAEAALRTSEEHYRTLFGSIDDAFCTYEMIFDEEGRPVDYRFLEVNDAFVAQTGLSRENALGKLTMREMVPDLEQKWYDLYGRVATTGEPVRIEDRAEALGRSYEIHAFRIGGEGSREVGAIFKDVSDRRRTEEERERLLAEIETEQAKLRTIFEQAPAFIAVFGGRDLIFDYVNAAYYGIVGHRPLLGLPLTQAIPEATGGGEGRDYDRLLLSVMDSGEPLSFAGRPVTLQRSPGAAFEERFLDIAYVPLRETDGTVSGILAHGIDVTDQVLARREMAALNDELEARVADRTAQLQAAIKEAEGFNYSIAHDLRSPLRAMVATSSILIEELGSELQEEHRTLLVRQAENAKRLGRLIDELLRLSRLARAEVHRERLDLSDKARSIFQELTEQGRTNGCRFDVQSDMAAQGDPGLVLTILHNLIGNACKFSPRGGTIRIREERGVFSVADEGVGFDMAFAAKIFIPFERLVSETEFEGTGIGLANVERIVRRHGGRVWVESEPGSGATFFFTLGG